MWRLDEYAPQIAASSRAQPDPQHMRKHRARLRSHQTPDLSTEPVHRVFAFDLAALISCT